MRPMKVRGPRIGVAMALATAAMTNKAKRARGRFTPSATAAGPPSGRMPSQRTTSSPAAITVAAASAVNRASPRVTPAGEPDIQASSCRARGSPLAESTPTRASINALRAIPASSMRSGANPERRPRARMTARTASPPSVAARFWLTALKWSVRKRPSATASRLPALTPRTSGLAISLCVTRCRMVPATASSAPAAVVASTRGIRQTTTCCHEPGTTNQSPVAPRLTSSDKAPSAMSPTMTAAVRPDRGRETGGPAARSGGRLTDRRPGSSKSSRGEPNTAVTAPVGRNSADAPANNWSDESVSSSTREPMIVDHSS